MSAFGQGKIVGLYERQGNYLTSGTRNTSRQKILLLANKGGLDVS
jgi:hypothetical protein